MARGHRFGERSLARLATVDARLAVLCHRAIQIVPYDLTVLCGRRTREEQAEALRTGHSKVAWPDSKHNVLEPDDLAKAVDLAPYPIDWTDHYRFCHLAGVMETLAVERDIPLTWGGNWDGDGVLVTDQRLIDLPHFQVDD